MAEVVCFLQKKSGFFVNFVFMFIAIIIDMV